MKRLLKWVFGAVLGLVILLALPIGYVELMCRGEALTQAESQFFPEPKDRRPEARTYLTYPEWHIVYAYDDYATTIEAGAPHDFPYLRSIWGFWASLCALSERADTLGEAGTDAKLTIYTIGASFTLEMTAKAIYEETVGRLFSVIGPPASPSDQIEEKMAREYATFLQQIPWYQFDFDEWTSRLWATPASGPRDWERRIALGGEWKAKSGYAKLIAKAAAGLGPDALRMLVATTSVAMPDRDDIERVSTNGAIAIYDVPRYRTFTVLAQNFAQDGGNFVEIAGNDDILVTLRATQAPSLPPDVEIIYDSRLANSEERRFLVAVKVTDLAALIRQISDQRTILEHIYDY